MTSDKFNLKWKHFGAHTVKTFQDLLHDNFHHDVTLVCDEDQISAHKVILSASSTFFRNVLGKNPHAHPLIYVRGVKFTHLKSLITFIYSGETNVAHEDLGSFMELAEDLKVQGLTEDQGGESNLRHQPELSRSRMPDISDSTSGHQGVRRVGPDALNVRITEEDKTKTIPVAGTSRQEKVQSEQTEGSNEVEEGDNSFSIIDIYSLSSQTVHQDHNDNFDIIKDENGQNDDSTQFQGTDNSNVGHHPDLSRSEMSDTNDSTTNHQRVRILDPEDLNAMITEEDKTNRVQVGRIQTGSKCDAPAQQAEGLMKGEDNLTRFHENFDDLEIMTPKQNNKIIVNSDKFTDIEELDAKIMEHIEKVSGGKWMCNICERIMNSRADVRRHVEIHFDGLSFPCPHCTKVAKTSNSLRKHISRYH